MLTAATEGMQAPLDVVFERVYGELHALAHYQLGARESAGTLVTTALVHEVYIKLVGGGVEYRDRRQFFALAVRAMRQIIIDSARAAHACKRGGALAARVVVDAPCVDPARAPDCADLVALDGALSTLEQLNDRLARIVELRFFGGLSVEETGEVLEVSTRTVKRDWRKAKAFLFQQLEGAACP